MWCGRADPVQVAWAYAVPVVATASTPATARIVSSKARSGSGPVGMITTSARSYCPPTAVSIPLRALAITRSVDATKATPSAIANAAAR